MRKIWKRVTAAALSLTFVLSLSACGGGGLSADDATTYVQGILDENYKGVYDPDFLELIDITEHSPAVVRLDENGEGIFPVGGGNVSVYLIKKAY